ncbi:DUF1338-domain-containing protein [Thozetella sp. PMI_491]|nr:DUF1338-domain-containing protein [Thozetella sp. PMI_491]
MPTRSPYLAPSHIRLALSKGLSDMYSKEVPQFAKLQQLVQRVNDAGRPEARVKDPLVPRHGAIRLASLSDLRDTARVLGVMGMRPVGYYDLSTVGLPIHATAFRSIFSEDLAVSPLRLFVSVLRPEVQRLPIVEEILRRRGPIFNQRALQLVDKAEEQGGLDGSDGFELAAAACQVLRWHGEARISLQQYETLRKEESGNLLVDILGFGTPHINHLTPATGDIDAVQMGMPEVGLAAKARVEGPPNRQCPLLLRQTSFLAVGENISFPGANGNITHTARFGEVEQRGAALTMKGRLKYDEAIRVATDKGLLSGPEGQEEYSRLFNAAFPDNWQALKDEGYIWAEYSLTQEGQLYALRRARNQGMRLSQAIADGLVAWRPIQYEDFLPLSAAGIFHSNLGGKAGANHALEHDGTTVKEEMRRVLPGTGMLDEMGLYAFQEAHSLKTCSEALGIF